MTGLLITAVGLAAAAVVVYRIAVAGRVFLREGGDLL